MIDCHWEFDWDTGGISVGSRIGAAAYPGVPGTCFDNQQDFGFFELVSCTSSPWMLDTRW